MTSLAATSLAATSFATTSLAMSGLAVERSFAANLAEDLSLEDIHQVLAVFGQDLERLTEILAVASGGGDIPTFRRAAHGLGGAAAAVGAAGLSRSCRDATERSHDPAAMPASLAAVRQEVSPVQAELARVLAWLEQQG
jgi:HPt (histidine-containing phosphotransfer) domain-containing protein